LTAAAPRTREQYIISRPAAATIKGEMHLGLLGWVQRQ